MTSQTSSLETAVFGGGCFWCTEAVFIRLKGIESVVSGYAGGQSKNPNYFKVSEGITGHAEVIKLEFDPSIISYDQLLEVFFAVHDPTMLNQQGADRGTEYRSIILYTSEDQKQKAENHLQKMKTSGAFVNPIVTQLQPLDVFYPAEEYHQLYYDRNQSQPYCQIVISPKVDKLFAKYPELIKEKYK